MARLRVWLGSGAIASCSWRKLWTGNQTTNVVTRRTPRATLTKRCSTINQYKLSSLSRKAKAVSNRAVRKAVMENLSQLHRLSLQESDVSSSRKFSIRVFMQLGWCCRMQTALREIPDNRNLLGGPTSFACGLMNNWRKPCVEGTNDRARGQHFHDRGAADTLCGTIAVK